MKKRKNRATYKMKFLEFFTLAASLNDNKKR